MQRRNSARQSTFDAIALGRRAANATVTQITKRELAVHAADCQCRTCRWSWRSTIDPGMFELWAGGQAVGTVSVLPGYVERRAVLMDRIVEHLNGEK